MSEPQAPAIGIRAARADELPAVSRLAARLVRMHRDFDAARFLVVEPLEAGYARYFRGELADPAAVILVADAGAGGGIVGYTYGRLEPRDWNNLLDACGAIHDIYVDDSVRGRGVGEGLMRATIAALEALGAPRVVLHSAWGNAAAQRLFEKLGFRRTMVEMTRERGPFA